MPEANPSGEPTKTSKDVQPEQLSELTQVIVTDTVVEKSTYRIEECRDCGERRKSFKDWICEDCWDKLNKKRLAIREKLLK